MYENDSERVRAFMQAGHDDHLIGGEPMPIATGRRLTEAVELLHEHLRIIPAFTYDVQRRFSPLLKKQT